MAIKKICLRLVDSGDEIFIHIIYCLCNFTCEPNRDSLSMDRWREKNNSHVTVTGMRKSQWWGRCLNRCGFVISSEDGFGRWWQWCYRITRHIILLKAILVPNSCFFSVNDKTVGVSLPIDWRRIR